MTLDTYPPPLTTYADVHRGFTEYDINSLLKTFDHLAVDLSGRGTEASLQDRIDAFQGMLEALANPRGRAILRANASLGDEVRQKLSEMSDERLDFYLTLLGLDEGELVVPDHVEALISATLARKWRLQLIERSARKAYALVLGELVGH